MQKCTPEQLEYKRRHYRNNKHVYRDNQYRRKYGFGIDGYNARYREQRGRCKCCGRTIREVGDNRPHFHIDHNHATGEVRGLLCHYCNIACGMLLDSPTRALMVARYLTETASSLDNCERMGILFCLHELRTRMSKMK